MKTLSRQEVRTASVPYDIAFQVQRMIYKSCLLMNEEAWSEFMQLCDPQAFRYCVVNYSPEMRREQCWADRDYKSMMSCFKFMPKHNSDHSKFTRQATLYTLDFDHQKNEARAVSGLSIYKTQLDGTNSHRESGMTSIYAVGTYEDVIRLADEQPKFLARTVRLDTRQLDVGSHKPF